MKKNLLFLILSAFLFVLSGCQAIGDIFKAGVWVGVLVVVLIIGVIIWLVTRASKKN